MHRSVASLPQQAFTSIDEWLRHLQTTVEAAPAEEDVAPEDVCYRSPFRSLCSTGIRFCSACYCLHSWRICFETVDCFLTNLVDRDMDRSSFCLDQFIHIICSGGELSIVAADARHQRNSRKTAGAPPKHCRVYVYCIFTKLRPSQCCLTIEKQFDHYLTHVFLSFSFSFSRIIARFLCLFAQTWARLRASRRRTTMRRPTPATGGKRPKPSNSNTRIA
jgi:hypothetical protein